MGFPVPRLFFRPQPVMVKRIDRSLRIIPIIEGNVTEVDQNGQLVTVEKKIIREIQDRSSDIATFLKSSPVTHVDFVYQLTDADDADGFVIHFDYLLEEIRDAIDERLVLVPFDHPLGAAEAPYEIVLGLEERREPHYPLSNILRV